MSYRDGFEDAVELCIAEMGRASSKDKALEKMNEFLGLIKEDKLERLKEMLWTVRK